MVGGQYGALDKPQKFVVRLPLDLKERIGDAAKYYRRSMNSEIVARLEQSFGVRSSLAEEEPPASQAAEPRPANTYLRYTLSPEEETLIRNYRRLSPEKQAALLELVD